MSTTTGNLPDDVDATVLRAWGPIVRRIAALVLAGLMGAGAVTAVDQNNGPAVDLVNEVRELRHEVAGVRADLAALRGEVGPLRDLVIRWTSGPR